MRSIENTSPRTSRRASSLVSPPGTVASTSKSTVLLRSNDVGLRPGIKGCPAVALLARLGNAPLVGQSLLEPSYIATDDCDVAARHISRTLSHLSSRAWD